MGKKVLLIEDDELITTLVATMFEDHDIDSDVALTGTDGILLFKKNLDYSLVITDFNLPDMNAEKIIHQIKRINPNQKIIVSSGMNIHNTQYLLDIGATYIISKPFREDELIQLI